MVSFTGALMVPKKTVRCHGGIPEMVSSNFHGTPPYDCFHPGTSMFCGVWHFAKQSVAAWIVLDGVQDYETKCASLMSDGKSWKAHWRLWMFFLVLVTFEPGSFQAQKNMAQEPRFCLDLVDISIFTAAWHCHSIMNAWRHHGINVVTPLRHHFCDTIKATLLWHH